jgi:ankyrin repeat protein
MAEVIDAIVAGHDERVRALAAADPSVAAETDENGVSALLLALYHGRPELAEALRPGKPELDVFEASALGDVGRLTELLDGTPGIVGAWAPDGFYPLGLAAFFGRPAAVRLLLDRGADVRQVARNERIRVTALHAAAAADDVESARMLLDAGADVDAEQPGGLTALDAAIQNGNDELRELLLARGATPRSA